MSTGAITSINWIHAGEIESCNAFVYGSSQGLLTVYLENAGSTRRAGPLTYWFSTGKVHPEVLI